MRKIVAGLFMSLDGVVEAPDVWSGPYQSEEVGQIIGAEIAAGDTLLLGRVTYETFVQAFGSANSDDPFAAALSAIPKVVVSTTLNTVEWQNSTLVSGDVAAAIRALKQQPGTNINISGSLTLVDWLLRQGLLDELNLLVSPVIVGSGKRLCEGDPAPLTLVSSAALSNGVLHLIYQPAA